MKKLEKIVDPLLYWYGENGRKLPWREGKNPYFIWLSEIMLQQTRIEAVKKYYERFIAEIPTIHDLAVIEEEKLLKLWEGLGYYNRARNLKKAAQIIEEEYQGEMPKTYAELLKLPGIGEYTAGAISSIAYNEKVPAVDGNVLRVIARVTGNRKNVLLPETKKEITQNLLEIMPKEAGNFNEAIMELGEVICLPSGEPLCRQCPLQSFCIARRENGIQEIPVREKKTVRKEEQRTVFILSCKGRVAIAKREKKGLLAGMYEFPNVMGEVEVKKTLKKWKLIPISIKKLEKSHHIFSHIEWKMEGYHIEVKKENTMFLWVTKEELLKEYPIPTAFQTYQKEVENTIDTPH